MVDSEIDVTDVVQPEDTNRWKSISTHTHTGSKYSINSVLVGTCSGHLVLPHY